MPGRYPELLKTAVVERAGRRAACHRDPRHTIRNGDLRLTIRVGRQVGRYCAACAGLILTRADQKIAALRVALEGPPG